MTFPHGYDDDCAFCTAFRFGPTHPNSVYLDDATARHANWTIFEDPNVVVLPTIGPVAPGHTMVLAREHYLSFAHVSPDLARYAESVAITLSGKLSAEFGDVIWFEHGPMSEKATGGSCTSHAHLHCVPVGDVDISGQINERLTGRRIESFADLAQQAEREQPYLYYRTQGVSTGYTTSPSTCRASSCAGSPRPRSATATGIGWRARILMWSTRPLPQCTGERC